MLIMNTMKSIQNIPYEVRIRHGTGGRRPIVDIPKQVAATEEERMEFKSIKIDKPEEINLILGQAHFIKTVDDLHEALATAVPGIQFGLAFCEASGPCLIRTSGTDPSLIDLATKNAFTLSAGHVFLILLRGVYPINVLNAVKSVQEVCTIYCASSNPVEVIVAETEQGRGVMGVIDGFRPKGVETDADLRSRKELLRRIGYKV